MDGGSYANHAGSHAIDRAFERYGIALLPSELAALEAGIGAGRGVLQKRTPGGEIWMVVHEGTAMIALWRPDLNKITTFLPTQKGDRAYIGAAEGRRLKAEAGRPKGSFWRGRKQRSEGRKPREWD